MKPPKGEFLPSSTTLFETLDSDQAQSAESVTTDTKPVTNVGYIRWPMWLIGPLVLLATIKYFLLCSVGQMQKNKPLETKVT
ncbi:hypothetical protein HanIR_Chr12g0567931 [Helianthus annuus]|nr:hypothetical protein HanIR_Chr12g0567931 [Helianthus annuus]